MYEPKSKSYIVVGIGTCKDTDLVIPSIYRGKPVTSIGDSAFYGCTGLTSVTIPDSVTSIGLEAFEGCTGLKTKIGVYKAFKLENDRLKCRGMEYKIGEWNECGSKLEVCRNGLHYCTNLFEIFDYYYGQIDKEIAICECEVDGEVLTSDTSNTSKCCARRLKPVRRLTRQEIIALLNGEEMRRNRNEKHTDEHKAKVV